jgi:hypothetical protein
VRGLVGRKSEVERGLKGMEKFGEDEGGEGEEQSWKEREEGGKYLGKCRREWEEDASGGAVEENWIS